MKFRAERHAQRTLPAEFIICLLEPADQAELGFGTGRVDLRHLRRAGSAS